MASNGSSVRAGGYAQGRYERGIRVWRSRTRLIIAAVFSPFLIVGLVVFVFDPHVLAWAAGVAFGAGAAAAIAMRESPPEYIEKWLLGAVGERKTEKVLRPLERSRWFVVHDVEHSHGNYDHIVVGRAGVFLLDSKNLQGVVHMRGGEPYLRRRSDPEADNRCRSLRSAALARAANLSEEIQRRTGRRRWVHAVVVLWSDFEEGIYEDEKCVLIHGSRLHEWIADRPDAVDDTITNELIQTIQQIAVESQSEELAEAGGRRLLRSAPSSLAPGTAATSGEPAD